jgi:hypothetical protein
MDNRGSKSILFLIKIVFYLIIIYFLVNLMDINQISVLTAETPALLATVVPTMNYLNADLDKGKILLDNYLKSGVYR